MLSRNLLHDIRREARRLRQLPGVNPTSLLTLAFGNGVASAISMFIHNVLLRLSSFPQQGDLVPAQIVRPSIVKRRDVGDSRRQYRSIRGSQSSAF